MGQPFIGEIRMFGADFAPKGWRLCDGSLLSVAQNETLYGLLGNTYGGDKTLFALPDLRGRVPLGTGPAYAAGNAGGAETVTLTQDQTPLHTHTLAATGAGFQQSPQGARPSAVQSTQSGVRVYGTGDASTATTLHPQTITAYGGSAPHNNLQPFQCLAFIIALEGITPSKT